DDRCSVDHVRDLTLRRRAVGVADIRARNWRGQDVHTRLRESHVRVAHRDQAIADASAPAPIVTGDLAHRAGDVVAKGVGDVAARTNRTFLFTLAARAWTKHRRSLGGALDRRRVVRGSRAGDGHPYTQQQGAKEPTHWPCSSPKSARLARSHVRDTANPVALLRAKS